MNSIRKSATQKPTLTITTKKKYRETEKCMGVEGLNVEHEVRSEIIRLIFIECTSCAL